MLRCPAYAWPGLAPAPCHTLTRVAHTLHRWPYVRHGGFLMGDDFNWHGVSKAVGWLLAAWEAPAPRQGGCKVTHAYAQGLGCSSAMMLEESTTVHAGTSHQRTHHTMHPQVKEFSAQCDVPFTVDGVKWIMKKPDKVADGAVRLKAQGCGQMPACGALHARHLSPTSH